MRLFSGDCLNLFKSALTEVVTESNSGPSGKPRCLHPYVSMQTGRTTWICPSRSIKWIKEWAVWTKRFQPQVRRSDGGLGAENKISLNLALSQFLCPSLLRASSVILFVAFLIHLHPSHSHAPAPPPLETSFLSFDLSFFHIAFFPFYPQQMRSLCLEIKECP